jgi:pyridoxamine 5'-phosphate oxidase
MNNSIADIRTDYKLKSLNEEDVAVNPFEQFSFWWKEAISSKIDEVNAMTLSTATNAGKPHARIVLLKGFDEKGFVFFTNYNSHKGNELNENPFAALTFFWKELERQVRIEGTVTKVSAEESDEYFNSRPEGSKLGAWISEQSTVIENRHILEQREEQFKQQFGDNIPRPKHWGGYAVKPTLFEFWQGRSNRLHDRIQYILENTNWKIQRLAP